MILETYYLYIIMYIHKSSIKLLFFKRGEDLFIIFLRFFVFLFFKNFYFLWIFFLNDEFNFKTPLGCCGFNVVMHIFHFSLLLLLNMIMIL